jgi:hypothetical protein
MLAPPSIAIVIDKICFIKGFHDWNSTSATPALAELRLMNARAKRRRDYFSEKSVSRENAVTCAKARPAARVPGPKKEPTR